MICKNCKREIPEGLKYCGNCGAEVAQRKVPLALILTVAVLVLGIAAGCLLFGGGNQSPVLGDDGHRDEIQLPTEPPRTEPPETEPARTEPSETEPPATEPPETEPPQTQPPQTEPEDRQTSVPEELRGNILLGFRDIGSCEKMLGDVAVTIIFADVPEGGWTPEVRAEMEQALEEEAKVMMAQAAEYGVKLNLTLNFLEAATSPCVYGEEDTWADATLNTIGMPSLYEVNQALETQYGVEAAPVIFYLNTVGRSRACWSNAEDGREFAVLYKEAQAFRHEMSHLFGAVDYYYPDLVEELAGRLFPDSIMASSAEKHVDSMTAYLIGWTDTLSPEAEEFLRLTNELTWETYWAEMGDEYITGYVTREFDYGTYTGDMVEGLLQGHGKLVWNTGEIYEGEWYFGNMHGYGTMIWEDGAVYEGYWENGLRHGQGTLTWADGTVYTGSWVDGQRSGYGTITWNNGTVYEGQWENDMRNGQGTMTFPNGTVQSGQFKDGEFIG